MIAADDLAVVDAALEQLEALRLRYLDLQSRVRAHAARVLEVPPVAWKAQADQLRAEVAEWRKEAQAVQAVGRPAKERLRGLDLCRDCRRVADLPDGAVASAPCPACGRDRPGSS